MGISDCFVWCDAKTPPLENTFVHCAVDYKGRRALRRSTGRWRSAGYMIGMEIAERFAYYGIGANLMMYLTGPLGQSTAGAAVNVNAWTGTASVLPLLGAFVADSFVGRYRTVVVASLLYVLGLGLLTLSAYMPSLSSHNCQGKHTVFCSPSLFQAVLFFFSLYLVAAAQSGHKPCAHAFAADQFDSDDADESKTKSSFFNWWYFSVSFGILMATLVVSYIQENFSWGLGYGILCTVMVIGTIIFLLGTKTYRFSATQNEKGPFTRIGRVFAAAFKNRGANPPFVAANMEPRDLLSRQCSQQFKFLNKAASAQRDAEEEGSFCSVVEVEEVKAILRLLPIWASCLIVGVVFAQLRTFFTKQAATMDRIIFSGFEIPAASNSAIFTITTLIFLPIYDRIFIPIARSFTEKSSGITMLQRIGTGIFVSITVMIIAALVEIKRLEMARVHGLIDKPNTTIPMSVLWLAPQNILLGFADVFCVVGMQEFFYDQVPTELRSIGIALYLSVFGAGNFLSSLFVSIIKRATSGDGRDNWFPNNLNRAHLDYFYWLLAGLSALGFASYLHFAKSYIYNRKVFSG